MSYDYKSYINNSVIRDIVNEMMVNPGATSQVVQDDRGRSWSIINGADSKIVGTEEYGQIPLLDRIGYTIALFFKCLHPTFRTNFRNAIQAINQASQNVQVIAEEIEKVASPIIHKKEERRVLEVESDEEGEEVAPSGTEVKSSDDEVDAEEVSYVKVDLAKDLIVTDFINTDALVNQIRNKTGSIRLANVWARLLGKFGDIVQSTQISNNRITINLKPVQGRKLDEQYKMWIPSSKNEQGVVEPEGGIVILLGSRIVLETEQKKLHVKEGYQNFVRVPKWARAFGEFNSANTSLMNEVGHDKIGITVSKSMFIKTITKTRDTNHDKLDHNWEIRGEVIEDNRSNEQIIKDHDHDYIAE